MKGQPYLRFRGREAKLSRHHANYLAALAFKLDRLAEDQRIASEFFRPQGVAQNHQVVLAGNVFPGIKRSSQLRPRTENGK